MTRAGQSLSGAPPAVAKKAASLPRVRLVNLKTAETLGIKLPPSIRKRADKAKE